jgi:glucosamine kinase
VFVLGVDGGSTKTICAISNEIFEVLGVGEAGPSNYHNVGIREAQKNVALAIKHALSVGGLERKRTDIGCFGIGGLWGAKEHEVISEFIKSLGVSKEYLIVNDTLAAYHAVTLGNPGIVVIAGTGSMAYGEDSDNNGVLLGGWGWLIGDEGGAFYIARKALMRITKAIDKRASKTKLMELAKKHFQISTFDDLVTAVYHNLPNPQAIASFAIMVSEAAQKGDEAAKEILEDSGKELALMAETVARNLGIADQQIIIGGVGSVWDSNIVWRVFKREVKKKLPRATFEKPVKFPVVGALAMGLSKKGIKVSKKDVEKLEKEIRSKFRQ